MLKRYRNALFQAIQKSGLSVTDFETVDDVTSQYGLVIRYKPAALDFTVVPDDDDPNWFSYSFMRYTGGDPAEVGPFPENGESQFEDVVVAFVVWLQEDVRTSIEEELLPDLWQSMTDALSQSYARSTTDSFSAVERGQIKVALRNFKILIKSEFEPSEDQARVITERIDYLASAVDRLNRFDWRGVTISTLMTIAVALNLDTETGRRLYALFQQAFTALTHLLQ
jgi:hypothetical protein